MVAPKTGEVIAAKPRDNSGPHTKIARQSRIAAVLAANPVRSQGELAQLLAAQGVAVTQATLSRDLEEMGALKVRHPGGGTVYAVPDEAPGPVLRALSDASDGRVSRLAAELLVSAEASANLVVARTPPGAHSHFRRSSIFLAPAGIVPMGTTCTSPRSFMTSRIASTMPATTGSPPTPGTSST